MVSCNYNTILQSFIAKSKKNIYWIMYIQSYNIGTKHRMTISEVCINLSILSKMYVSSLMFVNEPQSDAPGRSQLITSQTYLIQNCISCKENGFTSAILYNTSTLQK